MARRSAAARKIFVIAFAQPGDEGVSCRLPADSSGPMCFRERGKKFAGAWGKSTDRGGIRRLAVSLAEVTDVRHS